MGWPEGRRMKERLRKLLEELSLLDGLPGHEQALTRYLRDQFVPYADEVHVEHGCGVRS